MPQSCNNNMKYINIYYNANKLATDLKKDKTT